MDGTPGLPPGSPVDWLRSGFQPLSLEKQLIMFQVYTHLSRIDNQIGLAFLTKIMEYGMVGVFGTYFAGSYLNTWQDG